MSVFNYLLDIGITRIGPIDIISLYSAQPLRLIWISAILFVPLFVMINRPAHSFPILLKQFALAYASYLLVAPWASEQMLEPLLVLMLFIGASEGFKKSDFNYYIIGSAIVFVFLALHVPLTSLIFPVALIDPRSITSWGAELLPFLVLLFGIYLATLLVRNAKELSREFASL